MKLEISKMLISILNTSFGTVTFSTEIVDRF